MSCCGAVPPEDLRLADLLAALSVTTDLGMGQAPEKAVRSCLVATELARALDLSDPTVSDVYYTALLRHLGCTGTAHQEAYLFGGDELASRPQAERTDFKNLREMLSLMAGTGRGTGPRRVRYLARAMSAGKEANAAILRAVCEVGAHLAERLGLSPAVREALYQAVERWDGKGGPQKLSGEDISLPARVAEVAIQAVIFDRIGGPDAAAEMVRRRSGGWFDPTIAEAFDRIGPGLLERIAGADVWAEVLEAEPEPVRCLPEANVEDVARAFADMVDLKSPFTLGHSSGVADLAGRAAASLGFSETEQSNVRRSAHFHDLGRVGVSNRVWDKAGPLTSAEWEEVRLHPYHTERILARSTALEPLARVAGMHHERQDGSGYHHGASGGAVPTGARLLAAADTYQAMTQDRPHRPARAPDEAAEALAAEARGGRIDTECARAVIEAAGQRPTRVRSAWPAGLSDREVEVLRLMARGLSNKDLARRLFISPRTAEHHVQHIYVKIGASTRASAAMFAMEHGLVP
jgi:HD-GYP domain-containing protein (c-di-GMP phosphodiesterase class II)